MGAPLLSLFGNVEEDPFSSGVLDRAGAVRVPSVFDGADGRPQGDQPAAPPGLCDRTLDDELDLADALAALAWFDEGPVGDRRCPECLLVVCGC